MRNGKLLVLTIERTFLLFKNIGLLFFVPIIVVDVLIPVLNYISYSVHGISDELYYRISELTQIFIPFFSVWWVIFILKEFVDSDGCELLYTNQKTPAKSSIFMAFGIYCLNIIALYFIYSCLFKNFLMELIKILMVCVFFFGLSLFFSKLTDSTSITILILVMYTLINLIDYKHEGIFPLYFTGEKASLTMLFINSIPLAAIGLAFLLAGIFLRKKQ